MISCAAEDLSLGQMWGRKERLPELVSTPTPYALPLPASRVRIPYVFIEFVQLAA